MLFQLYDLISCKSPRRTHPNSQHFRHKSHSRHVYVGATAKHTSSAHISPGERYPALRAQPAIDRLTSLRARVWQMPCGGGQRAVRFRAA